MTGRIAKSARNARYGLLAQGLYLILNFAVRYALTHCIGLTAVSLNGLFSEILNILNLAELGLGLAVTYSLYQPLAVLQNGTEENKTVAQIKISGIMNLLHRAYLIIAAVIFTAGIALAPWIQYLVKNLDVSLAYMRLVYAMFVVQTSVSYLFSYKMILLTADQKSYVASKINLGVRTIFFGISLVMIAVFSSFIGYLMSEIGYNIVYYLVVDRKASAAYPYLDNTVELPAQEKHKIFLDIRHMFASKLSNKILNSTDNVLISTIVGTASVGIYSQYSMFLNGFLRVFASMNEAMVGSVGNMIASESSESTVQSLRRTTYLFFAAALICSCALYGGIDPFLANVMGKQYVLPRIVVYIAVLNMLYETAKMPLWTFFSAAGLFGADQWISMAGAVINLIVSIWWGKLWGIFGIFLGTTVSLLLMQAAKTAIFATRMQSSIHSDLLRWGFYLVTAGVCLWLTDLSVGIVGGWITKVLLGGCIGAAGAVLPYIKTDELRWAYKLCLHRRHDA